MSLVKRSHNFFRVLPLDKYFRVYMYNNGYTCTCTLCIHIIHCIYTVLLHVYTVEPWSNEQIGNKLFVLFCINVQYM